MEPKNKNVTVDWKFICPPGVSKQLLPGNKVKTPEGTIGTVTSVSPNTGLITLSIDQTQSKDMAAYLDTVIVNSVTPTQTPSYYGQAQMAGPYDWTTDGTTNYSNFPATNISPITYGPALAPTIITDPWLQPYTLQPNTIGGIDMAGTNADRIKKLEEVINSMTVMMEKMLEVQEQLATSMEKMLKEIYDLRVKQAGLDKVGDNNGFIADEW